MGKRMKKIIEFLRAKKIIIIAILGAILITMTLKTQSVIIAYGDDLSLRMDFTLYGYCISGMATMSAAQPAIENALYIGGSFEKTVLKAVGELEKISGSGKTVRINTYGYPRNNTKLTEKLVNIVKENGRNAEILKSE